MMENNMVIVETEEVVETIIDDVVVETGSKLNSIGAIGIGVASVALAGYAIYKAPKVINAIKNKIAERKADRDLVDYVTEEQTQEQE